MNSNLKYKVPIFILGLAGLCLVLSFIIKYGAGISPDSAYYISISRNFTNNSSYTGYDGNFLVLQPPFYPLFLSILKTVSGIDPLVSAGYCNAILFGLIITLTGLYLLKSLNSITLVYLAVILVSVSYVIIQASLLALSEVLFIWFTLIFINIFSNYIKRNDLSNILICSIIAALASLTRYIGIVLILTGFTSILIWNRSGIKVKLQHSVLFLVFSSLPIGIWILRNYYLSGTFFGPRGVSSYTLADNINLYISTILPWNLPPVTSKLYLIFIIVLILFWILLESGIIKSKGIDNLSTIGPSVIFVFIYSISLIVSSTLSAFDGISDRLLSPIYIPLLIIIFFIIDKILFLIKDYVPLRISVFLAAFIISIYQYYPIKNTKYILREFESNRGYEYGSKQWKDSKVIKFLINQKDLQEQYTYFSNVPEAVYILANIKTHWSPGKTMYNSPKPLDENSLFRNVWKKGDKVCLVWFNKINRKSLYTIEELQKENDMTEIASFEDGKIFKFIKR